MGRDGKYNDGLSCPILYTYIIMKYKLHKAAHGVYAIHLHIYFVTKYRRKFFTAPMIERMMQVCQNICQKNKSEVLEGGAEADHIHLLIDLHPDNNISQLVKSLKSETSKMIQTEFESEFRAVYYKTALWGRQKFIVSCGGAPLKSVQEYIKNQVSPQH